MAHSSQPEERAGWEISKDAFAPPPTRRTIRGWDRAPVSAHAPRLHGQKVWKKFGTLPGKVEDDSTEAQDELQKEGAGQRKKARPIGAKENIKDAGWLTLTPGVEGTSEVHRGVAISQLPTVLGDVTNLPSSTSVITKCPDLTMPELHFIPRKRTNTNHVITPKKPMRQTTLNRQAQRQSLLEPSKESISKRPRKSLRKSIRMSSIGSTVDEALAMPQSHTFTGPELAKHDQSGELYDAKESGTEIIQSSKSVRRSTRSTRASVVHAIQPTETAAAEDEAVIPKLVVESDVKQIPGLAENGPFVTVVEEVQMKAEIESEATTLELQDEKISSDDQLRESGSMDSSLSSIESDLFNDMTVSLPGTEAEVAHPKPKDEKDTDAAAIMEVRINLPSVGAGSTSPSELELPRRTELEQVGDASEFVVDKSEDCISKAMTDEVGPGHVVSHAPQPKTKEVEEEVDIKSTEDFSASSVLDFNASDIIDEFHIEIPKPTEAAEVSTSVTPNYDHDDTDMLLNFLTRVKANKAAKKVSPKRKRSLPHSPLRIPLGDMGNNLSPLSLQQEGEFDLAPVSPSKRKKRGIPLENEVEEPQSCRRSTRTRLPVKSGAPPPMAPSLIPMRRLGQEDTTVTLKRNEEKELAALTRVNTRKNKGGSLPALEVLARKVEEKDDPTMRQRLLKEVFDTKIENGKEKKGKAKGVTWAEELAQFQTLTKGKLEPKDEKEKEKSSQPGEEKMQSAVRVGVRSKMALGMAANGTPAPKRKVRGRA